ncbi:LPS assembly lipoprotein LptE [Roseobacteraceae bacterium S113]
MSALMGTASCSFTPALGRNGAASALYGQIETKAPLDPEEFEMTLALEERWGRGGVNAPFILDYSLNFESESLGADRDGASQREHLTGEAKYALRRRGESGALAQGKVHNLTGYSTTANTASTDAAAKQAKSRLIRILADDVVERVLLASPDLPL